MGALLGPFLPVVVGFVPLLFTWAAVELGLVLMRSSTVDREFEPGGAT